MPYVGKNVMFFNISSTDVLNVGLYMYFFNILHAMFLAVFKLDIHGSINHNINRTEITHEMRLCSRIYYSSVS
jgi:hypothetical protein